MGIGYVSVRKIPCICYTYLSKLDYPKNIIKDKYNQDRYKGEYWKFVSGLSYGRTLIGRLFTIMIVKSNIK